MSSWIKISASWFSFIVVYKRICCSIHWVLTTPKKENRSPMKDKKCLLGYVFMTYCNTRSNKLWLLQHKTPLGWEEEGVSELYFRAELGRCLSKNGLRDEYVCVGTRVCLCFGRERERSVVSGGKHPLRGPAFQLCESFSPHRHTLVISKVRSHCRHVE